MAAQTGLFVQQLADGSGTTAKGARQALAGLLAKNSDGTVRVGVLADGLGAVVTGAAGMTYNIRKHVAVTKVSEANGPTLVANDGSVSVSTDPAPGTNSRIDVIWVQQRHLVVDGGSDAVNTPVFGVAKGPTAAVPAVPSIPAGATELARVTVTAGTTATSGLTFTQGPWTVANGGSLPGADGKIDTDWIAPTLTTTGTPWVNFGSPRATAGYRRKNGVVHLKGMVANGTASVIFTLPPGFRPAATDRWDVPASGGTASIEIGSAGDVVVAVYKGGGDPSAVSLAPISFVAEL